MKRILFILTLLFVRAYSFGQSDDDAKLVDVDRYCKDTIGGEYATKFNTSAEQENFKDLREFLSTKEDLNISLNNELAKHRDNSELIPLYMEKIDAIRLVTKNDSNTEKMVDVAPKLLLSPTYNYNYLDNYGFQNASFGASSAFNSLSKVHVQEDLLLDQINLYKRNIANIQDEVKKRSILQRNISTVKEDIYLCNKQIESALSPEYKQQSFRVNISICFSVLIAVLLAVYFFILYQRSDKQLAKELLGGYGLQFVTVFILIIAITLFGILGILKDTELGTILSGISGYILGKGVPPAKMDGSSTTDQGKTPAAVVV